jgi:hypothetical protein
MALYLQCGLCGRKQADGILSRGAWGRLETDDGQVARACPACKSTYADWQQQLLAKSGG